MANGLTRPLNIEARAQKKTNIIEDIFGTPAERIQQRQLEAAQEIQQEQRVQKQKESDYRLFMQFERNFEKLTDKRSLQLRRTVKSGLSSVDITNLETLRKEPFVLFTDIDGSSHHVNLRYTDDLISSRVYANRNTAPEQTRVFTLEMTEVKTT